MAFKPKYRSKSSTRPNIPTASMGDIAFLIIIFFMTTSVFSRDKGLKIVLPEPGEEVKIKQENMVTVRVSPEGKVLIDDKVVTIPEVRQLVEEKIAANPKLSFGIKVSRRASYRVMIDVYDQLQLAYRELNLEKEQRISLVPVKEEEGG